MLTKAHLESAEFIIDPAYSTADSATETVSEYPCWLYGQYEFEAFMLEKMIREKDEAKLKVGYTDYRRKPANKAYFSAFFAEAEIFAFQAVGNVEVFLDGNPVFSAGDSDREHIITIPAAGNVTVFTECNSTENNIPALRVNANAERWSYSIDGATNAIPSVRKPGNGKGGVPHRNTIPLMKLYPGKKDGYWDMGKEILGFVEISCLPEEIPLLYAGESIEEMCNRNPEDEEQTGELVQTGTGIWRSKVPLALRYIQIEAAHDPAITVHALFHPVNYYGALSMPDDKELTKIWMHSAYTLHLCMMNFLNDGIKRDRLPWAGDLAVSLLGNAYSFADRQMIKDTLALFGAVSVKVAHINTIVDYSLWYIINHNFYQLWFGDMDFLRREYPAIRSTLDFLLELRDSNSFLRADRKGDWLFIDWVDGAKTTALQMLFFMALKAGAALAARMADSDRKDILDKAGEDLRQKIREKALDQEKHLFTSAPGKKEISRHANLLAAVSGIAGDTEKAAIRKALTGKELPPVGTPYMSVFEAMALAECGAPEDAVNIVREIWGNMLADGATTFWEGFTPGASFAENLTFYGRPFGKSLCHAWSAGPLFLLPRLLLGIEPLTDGWSTFKAEPMPGITINAAIPTPAGTVEIECENGIITKISAPDGCICITGKNQ